MAEDGAAAAPSMHEAHAANTGAAYADTSVATGSDGALVRDRSTRADARDAFDALTETIWRLRQPDGCPWDREQTHLSIAKNLIEEAYEALDCIEAGSEAHLCEELGDVLMQVMLHAQIAADAGAFTIEDVVRGLNEKLIRRHPHVFGSDSCAHDAAEVLDIWDSVKLSEKAASDAAAARSGDERPEGLLDAVPRALPALMQAQKVSRKAAAVGLEWESVSAVWDQVAEERAEYEHEPRGSDARELEFGDMLFALVNVARKEGIDAERALRASTAKFRARWTAVEDAAFSRGEAVEHLSTEELNRLWDEAKAGE